MYSVCTCSKRGVNWRYWPSTLAVSVVKAVSWEINPYGAASVHPNRSSALARQPVLWEEWHAKHVKRLFFVRLPDLIKIFVETVGVGQSETAVHSMVDFFLLIQLSGTGDELQGIKRGIMEMADGIVINKADGDNLERAKLAATQFRNALHLFPAPESGWFPKY